MTNTSLDFSLKTELRWLGKLVQQLQAAADAIPFFIAGAMSRDLILQHGYGINTGRETRDVDFAIQMESWEAFEQLRLRLVGSGKFAEVPKVARRLKFGGLFIDFVPFGAIERPDRTIAWPPDGSTIMNVIGFQEALTATVMLTLPESVTVRVVNLAGLALLKLMAWTDRRYTQPHKDAYDLELILRSYLDAGNNERLYNEATHLFEQDNFDYETAGAWLLGHDISRLLSPKSKESVVSVLKRETDPHGPLGLVGDMQCDTEKALMLINALQQGLTKS